MVSTFVWIRKTTLKKMLHWRDVRRWSGGGVFGPHGE